MIRFSLKCNAGHGFDSWFASGDRFEALRKSGLVTCPVCGSTSIEKGLMAPRVNAGASDAGGEPSPETASVPPANALSSPPTDPLSREIATLRARIERDTEDVGDRFATEARAIHAGEAPERAIRGRADPKTARALAEDGIPVLPLPFGDPKKAN